jgi:hypothetical protein
MINFSEAAVVFLLLTNSARLASSCAMRLMHSFAYAKRDIKRKLDLILGRTV